LKEIKSPLSPLFQRGEFYGIKISPAPSFSKRGIYFDKIKSTQD